MGHARHYFFFGFFSPTLAEGALLGGLGLRYPKLADSPSLHARSANNYAIGAIFPGQLADWMRRSRIFDNEGTEIGWGWLTDIGRRGEGVSALLGGG